MKTSRKKVVTMMISLKEDERFIIKHPRGRQTCKVKLIEVHDGYFFVYGDLSWRKNQPGACLKMQHTFTSINDEALMPYAVAHEIQRCLNLMREEVA